MKLFIEWYIKKYWGTEYIPKSRIKDELLSARNEEAIMYKKLLKEELDHLTEVKDLEKDIACAALQAEVSRLESIIDSHRDLKKNLEKRELNTKQTAQTNLTMSMELKYMVNKLLETIAVISGKFDTLTTKAEEHVTVIEDNLTKPRS